jgi:hypothetical protein
MNTVDCYRLLLSIPVNGHHGNASNELITQHAVLHGQLGVHCHSVMLER